MNIGSDDMNAPLTTGCMNIGGGRDIPYQKVDGCMNYRMSFLSFESTLPASPLPLSCFGLVC